MIETKRAAGWSRKGGGAREGIIDRWRSTFSEWLRGLGLERYDAAFRDNDIDGSVLLRLTAEDLREIGVASVGHRRRLIEALVALKSPSAVPPPDRADAALAVATSPERRQLTVMFADLVGSTPLAARLDPEDLREVIGAYHRCVADTVGRFGGFVAKYMGDGVLVYFGYPQAREDDAERAVAAGLALVGAVAVLRPRDGAALACRVGFATGLVVVGDLIGAGAAQEQAVVGETPNLAARLQALAAANAVLIGERTRRLIGGLFEIEALGPQQLAGLQHPFKSDLREAALGLGISTAHIAVDAGKPDLFEVLRAGVRWRFRHR